MSTKNFRGSGKADCAGFTLIEVLIATMILTSVIYLATLSYSMLLDVWGEKRLTDIRAINDYRYHTLLRSALESTCDYYVTDRSNERTGFYYPFFKGGRERIEFVTLSSVFQKGAPAVARLRLEGEGEERDLIYEETTLEQDYIRYDDAHLEYKYSIIAYHNIEKASIRYYGESERRLVQDEMDFETIYKWHETFFGKERNTIPQKIEITVSGKDGEKRLLYTIRAASIYKRGFFRREF